jgi:transposase
LLKLVSYEINHDALALAELMDGKWLLVTNCKDLTSPSVVERYKSLADIERGFRVLKSEIEIGPVFHRLPGRIRVHASICFIALILYRVMRQRLTAADCELSPEQALEQLQRLQHHQIHVSQSAKPISGISRLSETHNRVFAALNLKKPPQPRRLPLL